MKKVLSVLAVCLIAVMVVSLAACKKQENTAPTANVTEATSASETAAPTAAAAAETTAAAQQQTGEDVQSEQNDTPQSEVVSVDEDSYIAEAVAIENVRKQVGAEATILSYYKGYTEDGIPAWVITVQPVTNGTGPELVTYYSGDQFCYPLAGNDALDAPADEAGYIDETVANE